MLKDTILMVQTCDLKVVIHCDGCLKEIKKILKKIDGVYQINVDRQQGKLTVTGQMDMDIVFKKMKKACISVQLWDANSDVVSKHQTPQLCGSGKGLPQGEASSGGCGARSSGGTNNDATIVLPQLTPTPEQHVSSIQQQIEQRLRMLNGESLPHQPMGLPPTINNGGKQSSKKICGGTKVLVPGNANDVNKNKGMKLYPDVGGNQIQNDAIGQPLHNGALGSLNNRSQAKKDMIGPTSFPTNNLDGYNVVNMPRDGFYPRSAVISGMEMMQQNPMPQQPYMMVQPRQEHEMKMNAQFTHSQNAHYGPGCTRYQLMGYDNGHGHLQQQYPMPLPPQHENIFSDENPNICSLM